MGESDFNFYNILVIDFGQLGDLVLSLPALRAIRLRFPSARITLLLGKPGADIIRMADVSDDQILVDRVALRDGNKVRSLARLLGLVREVRGRKFDFVIDLHSLSETNILGFLSGARWRLYANRENRSIDSLSRFPTRPPREDRSKHHFERYFDALLPLGIQPSRREFLLRPPSEMLAETNDLLHSLDIAHKNLIGLFLGAGHPSRRWDIEKFVELARRLGGNTQNQVLVLLGPEERDLRSGLSQRLGQTAMVMDEMPLVSFFSLLSRLAVFVGGDTGPMHLAAVAGAGIVLISQKGAPDIFLPLTRNVEVLDKYPLNLLPVDDVAHAVFGLERGDSYLPRRDL